MARRQVRSSGGRKRSRARRGGGLYKEPKSKRLADIVRFDSVTGARKAVRILVKALQDPQFKRDIGLGNVSKTHIVRALNNAANRALVTAKRHPNLKRSTRQRLKQVGQIYRRGYERAKRILSK